MDSTIETKKICVISLTYNRPEYIKRSFDSLYARATYAFDHFVFDDCSDSKTTEMLRMLEKKYNFKLIQNKTRLGIFKNFHKNIKYIDNIYDLYMKFDSDIEILSDSFLQQILDIAYMPAKISVISPRIEGMFNSQRLDLPVHRVEFYNGHAFRTTPLANGCCLIFSKLAFESFPRMTDNAINNSQEQFAVDSQLYKHAINYGTSILIEDLSVYHIDNTYGQRRKDTEYFIARNRWVTVDKDEIWFYRVSKEIYPRHLTRQVLDMLKRSSADKYDAFSKACKDALACGIDEDRDNLEVRRILGDVKQKDIPKIDIYKISAPENFIGSRNLAKGAIMYCQVIPDWARSDSGVVIEKVRMSIDDARQVISE
jgi:glycosyltransferase involved in cell wall biosynthesis